jgi:hypothetical protein
MFSRLLKQGQPQAARLAEVADVVIGVIAGDLERRIGRHGKGLAGA